MKKIELSIPKPCHENWEAMTPEDKGRFCGACQKTVIDFTDMSDRQIAEFFKKPAGNVCGRFAGDQLNRVIDTPRKRLPWIKHFFTIAIPALLFSIKAGAQGQVRLKGKVAICEKPGTKKDTLRTPQVTDPDSRPVRLGLVRPATEHQKKDSSVAIRGRVLDENGNPLQSATIMLTDSRQATITDANGNFSLRSKQAEATVEVSLVGFNMQRVNYSGESFLTITLEPHNREMLGEVVIVAVKKRAPVPLMPSGIGDTITSSFSVFPNPVASSASFTIHPKALETGRYILSILTSTGELIKSKQVVIRNKEALTVQVENVAAAPYFIRLTNQENSKAHTEILLVK